MVKKVPKTAPRRPGSPPEPEIPRHRHRSRHPRRRDATSEIREPDPRRQERRDRSRHRSRPRGRAHVPAMVAQRFPDHVVLAEEMGESGHDSRYRWVFDPLDGTTNLRSRHPDLLRDAGARDRRRPERRCGLRSEPQRAVHGRARRRRVAERRAAAGVDDRDAARRGARDRLSLRHLRPARRSARAVWGVSRPRACGAPAGLGRDRPVLDRGRSHGRVLGAGTARRGTRWPAR